MELVDKIPLRPQSSIAKYPENANTRNFPISIQTGMNFGHRLSPYCFNEQAIIFSTGSIGKSPWFNFAHTETGGGASFALLNRRIKFWYASTSATSVRVFERCFHSREVFIEMMQWGARERGAQYLYFAIQRPGDLIYIPCLLAHAVLTSDSGSPTVSSR